MANTNNTQNQYKPDYVSPPGETLLETLETIGMSQAELAKRMGRPTKTVNEIVQAKAAITNETALQLERVLHIPASFWINGERNYQESLARRAEDRRLKSWVSWLRKIPIHEMMQRGWIPSSSDKTEQVLEALKFFGAASPDAWLAIWESELSEDWKALAAEGKLGAVTAWLRQGEIAAQEIDCMPYSSAAFREALAHIRDLTVKSVEVFQMELVRLCATAGVAVVFVQEFPETGVCGATQWLTSVKALAQLGLRYKTVEQLRAAFLHEADHILHGGKRQFFLEYEQGNREIYTGEIKTDEINTSTTSRLRHHSQVTE